MAKKTVTFRWEPDEMSRFSESVEKAAREAGRGSIKRSEAFREVLSDFANDPDPTVFE